MKQGLDYFPLDVDLFDADPRVRVLMHKFGAEGLCLYLYVLCRCYGGRGYYALADEAFFELAGCDLGLAEDRTRAIVDFLAQKGLLDAARLRQGVLTSHGIQARYQEAIRQRMHRRSRGQPVEPDIWLLPPKETCDYIEGLSGEKPPKEKKEKERKEKESRAAAFPAAGSPPPEPETAHGSFDNVRLTAQELEELQRRFPDWERRIERLSAYMASTGKQYQSHFATLVAWSEEDARRPPPQQRPFKGLQPPPGDFRQPVAAKPGAFEQAAIRRLQERGRAGTEGDRSKGDDT